MSFVLTCTIQHETDNAILILDYASGETVWIPLSQVNEITRYRDGTARIEMSDWIARMKGFL